MARVFRNPIALGVLAVLLLVLIGSTVAVVPRPSRR
jgi:hypothetical protein